MPKIIILSDNAPKPIGPYSQAVSAGNLIFCAGQIAIDNKAGKISAFDITGQTRQAIENIAAVLSAAGAKLQDVVKTTVYLKDLNDFAKMNEVYACYFLEETAPARSTIQAARLPMDALIEIEAIALKH